MARPRLPPSPKPRVGRVWISRIFPEVSIRSKRPESRSVKRASPFGRKAIPHGTSRFVAITLVSTSRSEEHTSELQSRQYLVCRLLLEQKKYLPLQPSP